MVTIEKTKTSNGDTVYEAQCNGGIIDYSESLEWLLMRLSKITEQFKDDL